MRTLLLCGLLLALSACGFQLRGQAELPPAMDTTHIDTRRPPGARPSELAPVLGRILEANGVVLSDDPETAGARLEILLESGRSRTLASDERGDVRETTLIYEVHYRVLDAAGEVLIPADRVLLTRDILYAERDVLGRQEGEQLALRDLRTDAAYAIVRRIQALHRQTQPS